MFSMLNLNISSSTGELAESRQTEVTIRDVDETAMEILIEFCYTSHIVVEESNVQTLLPAACLLQLAEIQVGVPPFFLDMSMPSGEILLTATHSKMSDIVLFKEQQRGSFGRNAHIKTMTMWNSHLSNVQIPLRDGRTSIPQSHVLLAQFLAGTRISTHNLVTCIFLPWHYLLFRLKYLNKIILRKALGYDLPEC